MVKKLIFLLCISFIIGCSSTERYGGNINNKEKNVYIDKYEYNLQGEVIKFWYYKGWGDEICTSSFTYEYQYDNNNRKISKTTINGDLEKVREEKYSYDEINGLIFTESFNENKVLLEKRVYNTINKFETIERNEGKIKIYIFNVYDENDNIVYSLEKNDKGTVFYSSVYINEYDKTNKKLLISTKYGKFNKRKGEYLYDKTDYKYVLDEFGRIIESTAEE